MDLWIPITIAAAFAQNLRFMLQKHLSRAQLSVIGATYARFLYATPLIGLIVLSLWATGYSIPQTHQTFWTYVIIGGIAQIIATLCVVALFAARNFTVGITLKKTEVLQTAFFGMLILGEGLSGGGWLAILIGMIGVILLSDPPEGGTDFKRFFNKAAGFGLMSGAFFGISGVAYRGASLSLPDGDFIIRATFTLFCTTLVQTLAMGLAMAWRDPAQLRAVFSSWRVSSLVGLTGMLGSIGWFMAFTLQNAAYVKALGQIELVFTFAASYFVFKERSSGREILGIALIVVSILVLILGLRSVR